MEQFSYFYVKSKNGRNSVVNVLQGLQYGSASEL